MGFEFTSKAGRLVTPRLLSRLGRLVGGPASIVGEGVRFLEIATCG